MDPTRRARWRIDISHMLLPACESTVRAVAQVQSVLDADSQGGTMCVVTGSNLRKARGPLTALAFLLLGAATAAVFWLNKPADTVGTESAEVKTTKVDLSGTSSTSLPDSTPDTTPDTPPETTPSTTSEVSPTTTTTTTAPPTTGATTSAPTTVVFQWGDRLPLLPPGGNAVLVGKPTSSSYTADVSYSLTSAEISAQLVEYLKNASWSVSSSSTSSVLASSAEIRGTFTISPTSSGSKVRIQFSRPAA